MEHCFKNSRKSMGGSRWLHKAQNYPQILERKKMSPAMTEPYPAIESRLYGNASKNSGNQWVTQGGSKGHR